MRIEDARTLKECYAMGHGIDFCTGRNLVIGKADDLTDDMISLLCRWWKADKNEVILGMQYQRGIEAAAKRMLAERGGKRKAKI